ncbi:MAG: hypothetical protein OQL06_08985 [Gammaproteobacteria bacterium]|nr:hypothetical protein [Gammaproteobacteria bacterium]
MDATAILAVLGVIGSVIVFTFLGVRINKLMKTTDSSGYEFEPND